MVLPIPTLSPAAWRHMHGAPHAHQLSQGGFRTCLVGSAGDHMVVQQGAQEGLVGQQLLLGGPAVGQGPLDAVVAGHEDCGNQLWIV
jgi:hypothetical protein